MEYVPVAAATLVMGLGCGYFQYWMALRLDRKRWLLLLQPGLLAVIAGCFAAWTASIERLKNSPARLAFLPFAALLLFTLAGWGLAALRRTRK